MFFGLLISAILMIGCFVGYTESKYVTKEVYQVEVGILKELLMAQDKKLDKIFDLIKRGGM